LKPIIHAKSSAKLFGGKPEDYLEIHEFMDSSKVAFPDNRHRTLTHNTWFIYKVLPRIFGTTITNSGGKDVSVREIGEQHVLEDYKKRFIPSVQDYLSEMDFPTWLNNGEGEAPASCQRLPTNQIKSVKKIGWQHSD
jgi:hypothetical protein